MNVEFPPIERVNLFGDFSRGELIGAAVATTVFGLGIMAGQLVPAVVIPVLMLLWTFTPTRRRPFRVIVPARVRWMLRRDRMWSAPMRGTPTAPAFLRGMEVQLVDGDSGAVAPVGVVCWRRSYTVMFTVDRAALTFSSETEQDQALDGWGKVLGALCVERHTEMTAERVGWTDLHRAADPAALVRHHDLHGVAGPGLGRLPRASGDVRHARGGARRRRVGHGHPGRPVPVGEAVRDARLDHRGDARRRDPRGRDPVRRARRPRVHRRAADVAGGHRAAGDPRDGSVPAAGIARPAGSGSRWPSGRSRRAR